MLTTHFITAILTGAVTVISLLIVFAIKAPDLFLIEFVDKKNYKMPPYALNKRKRGQDLSWKKVDHKFADAEGDGWMGLEEIDGVDVDFEEGHSGERIVKLRVSI